MTIQRILCPVDFSETSMRAADYAVELARGSGASSVCFAHVWMVPMATMPDGIVLYGPDVLHDVVQGLRRELHALAERHRGRGVVIEERLVEGAPFVEIGRLARELPADLVVMGTHGRTGLPHLLLGSVAERVVQTSHVPVLTVPPLRTTRPSELAEPARSAPAPP